MREPTYNYDDYATSNPPIASNNLESSTPPDAAAPVDTLEVDDRTDVGVVGVLLDVVLGVDTLAPEAKSHSLSTLDDTFSGAVRQYAT